MSINCIKKISIEQLYELLDLVAWVELESLNMNNSEDKAWLMRRLKRMEYSGCDFFGYYYNDKLIGFATIMIEDRPASACDGYGACELLQLGIADEYRNKGYASELLKYIEDYLKQRKVYCMYMHTYPVEYSVVAFYGKNGYIPRGLIPGVYGPNLEGMLYMSKILDNSKPKCNP